MRRSKDTLKSNSLVTLDVTGSSPEQFLQVLSQMSPASAAAITKVLDHCAKGDIVEAMLLTQMLLTHTVIVENIEARSGLMPNPDALKNAAKFTQLFNDQVAALKKYRQCTGTSININNILAGGAVVSAKPEDQTKTWSTEANEV